MTTGGVEIVDELDRPVGVRPIEDVWEQGLLHRIVLVVVKNQAGEILLQRRAAHMKLFPDCWDYAAAGHVDEGETYEAAALRELEEEAGITGRTLREVERFQSDDRWEDKKLNRFYRLYEVTVDGEPIPDHDEVVGFTWMNLRELDERMRAHPDEFSPGFTGVFRRNYLS